MADYKEFLSCLFPSLNDGFIEIRSVHPKTKMVKSIFYSSIDELVRNQPVVDSLSKEYNVYFGVCPRQEKKGSKEVVKYVWALWVDLDPKNFKSGKPEILERLNSFPIPPSIIVDSGNGFHAYWRLREPSEIRNSEDVSKIEAYLKALSLALEGDSAAAELARILRLPGTLNHKSLMFPKQVNIVELSENQQCNLSDFDSILTFEPSSGYQKN